MSGLNYKGGRDKFSNLSSTKKEGNKLKNVIQTMSLSLSLSLIFF